MKTSTRLICLLTTGLTFFYINVQGQTNERQKNSSTDPIAENMLAYQRSIGGWPKAVGKVAVNYDKVLSESQRLAIEADSLHNDATIDNKATSKEIRYLIKAYKTKQDPRYLAAVQRGVDYLLEAQYDNGGWSQYYPDNSSYRGEITYNDNAMTNVLNIMQDIVDGKKDFDQLNDIYKAKAAQSVQKGVSCILKTQVPVNGKLTVWCAQYDEKTMKPAKARSFELISLSGSESVAITEFLMRIKKPSKEVQQAIHGAMAWFQQSKIEGYEFVFVDDPQDAKEKDRVLVAKPGAVIWARFYDIDTNEPFFTGRDGVKKKTVAEIEKERRTGYSWYGTWPAKLFATKYPAWQKKI